MAKKKNTALKVLGIILGVIVALVLVVLCVWNKELRTIATVHQVDKDGYVYEMNYLATYDLDDVITKDIDQNTKLLEYVITRLSKGLYKPHVKKAGTDFSCTSFQAIKSDSTGYWFGRNYDFFKNPIMVMHSHPKDGYASMSTCDLSHLGYSLDKLPKSFVSKALCIAAAYAPMDGINEKGLCISIMALPRQASQQSTGKHCVGTSIIMRLILDRCATVDEALELASTVDIRHDATTAKTGYHYMIADAAGNAAVLEFDKDDQWKSMIVHKADTANFMACTNHLLSPKYYTEVPDSTVGNPNSKSWWRYQTVTDYLKSRDGVLSHDEAQECLALVHWKDCKWPNGLVEDTQWSNVYDQTNLCLDMRPWCEYDTTYHFDF